MKKACSCCEGHCVEIDEKLEEERENGDGRLFLARIFISLILLGLGIYFKNIYLTILSYLISGYDVLFESVKNIIKGKVFDETFLMSVASTGAFLIGEGEEGAAVMIFYCLGEYFQNLAVEKSNKAISAILDLRPDYAFVMRDGQIEKVNPKDVNVGEIMVVKSGEKVPLDGILLSEEGIFDTKAISGESLAKVIKRGGEVLSGYIANERACEIEVTKPFSESMASKIVKLMQTARQNKAKREDFIKRFAKIYTPSVVMFAVLLALIPSLVFGKDLNTWIHRALVFLVASCPCALVLSVPLSFYAGMGNSSRHGVLVKGGNFIEVLSKLDLVAFDKTGTLTYGVMKVNEILPQEGFSKEEVLYYAKSAEQNSNHPLAKAILNEGADISGAKVTDSKELSGLGVVAQVDGKKVVVGRKKLLDDENIPCKEVNDTALYVGVDGNFAGAITFTDTIKENAQKTIQKLHDRKIKTMIVSGDSEGPVKNTANALGVTNYHHSLFPEDKLEIVKSQKGTVAFVGDGINDAPVLAASDIGISMGTIGQDAAIEASDAVIMGDDPVRIISAIDSGKKTMRITRQNIIFVLLVKFLVLALGAAGIANMWLAVFADVGALLIAVLNTLRIIFYKCKTVEV